MLMYGDVCCVLVSSFVPLVYHVTACWSGFAAVGKLEEARAQRATDEGMPLRGHWCFFFLMWEARNILYVNHSIWNH